MTPFRCTTLKLDVLSRGDRFDLKKWIAGPFVRALTSGGGPEEQRS